MPRTLKIDPDDRKDTDADSYAQHVRGLRYVDELVCRDRDTDANGSLDERLYALQDSNFNVTALSDTSGSIVERFSYTPYGQRTVLDAGFGLDADGISDVEFEIGHQGLLHDNESGLIYNRNRMLHSQLGRFLQRDPLGYVDGGSLYEYVRTNPLRFVDAMGLDTYTQNRQLNPDSCPVRDPVEHGVSHTFIFTTRILPNGVEVIEHTYSWGNTYDDQGNAIWHQDAPEDLSAARTALIQRDAYNMAPWYARPFMSDNWGTRVGDETLDQFVHNAFLERIDDLDHSSYHPWRLFNNCKHEAQQLLDDARRLRGDPPPPNCPFPPFTGV